MSPKKLVEVIVYKDVVLSENSDNAKALHDDGLFGLLKENGQLHLPTSQWPGGVDCTSQGYFELPTPH